MATPTSGSDALTYILHEASFTTGITATEGVRAAWPATPVPAALVERHWMRWMRWMCCQTVDFHDGVWPDNPGVTLNKEGPAGHGRAGADC